MEILNRILAWLDEKLPWLLLAFKVGQNQADKQVNELKKELIDSELKEKEAENAQKVTNDNIGKSDADIVRDIIKGG